MTAEQAMQRNRKGKDMVGVRLLDPSFHGPESGILITVPPPFEDTKQWTAGTRCHEAAEPTGLRGNLDVDSWWQARACHPVPGGLLAPC